MVSGNEANKNQNKHMKEERNDGKSGKTTRSEESHHIRKGKSLSCHGRMKVNVMVERRE